MKQSNKLIAALSILTFPALCSLSVSAQRAVEPLTAEAVEVVEVIDTVANPIDSTLFIPRELDELLAELGNSKVETLSFNRLLGPWIFSGYRQQTHKKKFTPPTGIKYPGMTPPSTDSLSNELNELIEVIGTDSPDSIPMQEEDILFAEEVESPVADLSVLAPNYTPEWLRSAVIQMRQQDDMMYNRMIYHPASIDYAYWDLPEPPVLPDDEVTFEAYIRKLDLPDIETDKAILPDVEIKKIHWLHNFNASAQFSQAYVSANWYQGGNNHLALLLGANWNVQLNQVYHPNLLFQSNLSYKLGLYSTPDDQIHKYSISEDVLQWNLNTGLKALKKWYYSFNAQFKTQIFKNYKSNSHDLKAMFLSPGDFNMGLGMSYSNKKPNLEFTATISPFSYNLKTCITDKMDHSQFNIEQNRKTHSEFGSNAEFNMNWNIRYNINYKTRLFLFSDYSYFLADWENTLNFEFNRFLSTQIYVHLRYDTSTDVATKWKHLMMREVLSFGLSYTFSTK